MKEDLIRVHKRGPTWHIRTTKLAYCTETICNTRIYPEDCPEYLTINYEDRRLVEDFCPICLQWWELQKGESTMDNDATQLDIEIRKLQELQMELKSTIGNAKEALPDFYFFDLDTTVEN